MSLHPLIGHDGLQSSLSRALLASTLPQSIIIHGPRGVGKQRLALWLGQLLLCDDTTAQGPCSNCKNCRLSLALEHPDLHWYFPLSKPKGVRADKLADALETIRHDTLTEHRKNSLRPSLASREPHGLYLATAQFLRSQAQKPPAMGSYQVIVIGDAETLVPQESSQEAANALLKLLEEPPPRTFFALTSSEPGRLLATIRSRAMPLHLPSLSNEQTTRFLMEETGADAVSAARAARLGRGSIGRALGFLPDEDGPGPLEILRQQAFRLLAAASDGDAGSIYRRSLEFGPTKSRGLIPLLDLVENALRDLSAAALSSPEKITNDDTLDFLERICNDWDIHPVAVTHAFRHVDVARELASGNVNSQLVVAGLLTGLREALSGTL